MRVTCLVGVIFGTVTRTTIYMQSIQSWSDLASVVVFFFRSSVSHLPACSPNGVTTFYIGRGRKKVYASTRPRLHVQSTQTHTNRRRTEAGTRGSSKWMRTMLTVMLMQNICGILDAINGVIFCLMACASLCTTKNRLPIHTDASSQSEYKSHFVLSLCLCRSSSLLAVLSFFFFAAAAVGLYFHLFSRLHTETPTQQCLLFKLSEQE